TNYSHGAEKTKKDWCGLETDIPDVAASLNLICCYLGNVSDTDKTFPGLCAESTSDAFSCAFLEGRMRRKEVVLHEVPRREEKK
ncbi:hypothetical protein KUCAC02_017438, partial [Chaenocephalus aceratus]